MTRQNDYITEARVANKKIWEGINDLIALQREWVAMDYTDTLPDGTGNNEGYTRQEVSDVVNTTANALSALLDQGHGTNMANLL